MPNIHVPYLNMYVILSMYLGFIHAYSPMVTVSMEHNVCKLHALEGGECGGVCVGRALAWVSSPTLHKMGRGVIPAEGSQNGGSKLALTACCV